MKKYNRVFLTLLFSLLFLLPAGFVHPVWAAMTETDQEAIYKVINKLEEYYERRRLSKFIDLFSEQKFYNYIAFKEAVEGDFDLYKDIRLKRIDERLYLAESRAIYQAVWEKQYRPSLNAPFERQRGLVRIMLEKFGGKWKIIDLQGYPIFGTSGLKLPDLTVTNVWIMGGGRRIIGVVRNIGPGTAKGFYVGFYAGTTFLGKAFVAILAPKQSKNISWVWTPDPNRRLSDIRVVADVTHRVKELREDNNVGKISIRPGDTSYCVDLAVDDRGLDVPSSIKSGTTVQVGNTVTTAPSGDTKTLKEGERVRICGVFQNLGGLNTTNVPVKVYYVTERPSKTVTIYQRVYPQVPSKGRMRFCFTWTVPDLEKNSSDKTRRYIRVVLDPDNSIPECSEGNNMTEQEIAIVNSAGPYDGTLTVSDPARMPREPCGGVSDVLTVTVTVEDLDLIDQSSTQVTIESDAGDRETYTLNRISSGVFRGTAFRSCILAGAPPVIGDGILGVNANGGHVTVSYTDKRDAQGRTVVRSQTVRYIP